MKIEDGLVLLMSIWLFLCAWQDIKRKKIKIYLIGAGFVVLVVCSIIAGDIILWDRCGGLGLGIVLLILNPITRGQIGIGDGLVVSIVGLCLGFKIVSVILILALFGSALFSVFLLLFHKVGRKKTIPFIPFLLIGYLGAMVI